MKSSIVLNRLPVSFSDFTYEHGIVIGRCMPPHVGHIALAHFAASQCRKVIFLVEQRPDEIIPVQTRAAWLKEGINNDRVEVKLLLGDHPQAPPEDPMAQAAFWDHWNTVFRSYAPKTNVVISGAVISGDDYGKRLAADLDVPWIPFDRSILPICATKIRELPWEQWSWLIQPARMALVRRLVVVGPESTGKTTLSRSLAAILPNPTLVIPEYAESWIKRTQPEKLDEKALHVFLNGQIACRNAWFPHANQWVVEDSHALTTAVWAHHLGFNCAAEITAIAAADKPHHVLLLSPDGVPWIDDEHRYRPNDRMDFFNTFKSLMDEWNWSYSVINGDWDERLEQGTAITKNLLMKWQATSLEEWLAEGYAILPKIEENVRIVPEEEKQDGGPSIYHHARSPANTLKSMGIWSRNQPINIRRSLSADAYTTPRNTQ